MQFPSLFRAGRIVALFAAAFLVTACANKDQDANGFGAGMGAATPGSMQDFTVNVGDRVLFLEDQSTLTPEAQGILDKQSAWLRQYPQYVFTVEGHADENGTREYNLALGARRAATVRDFLVSRGIPQNRMKTISYGKERPVAVCESESCWSQNRRAVTVLGGGAGM